MLQSNRQQATQQTTLIRSIQNLPSPAKHTLYDRERPLSSCRVTDNTTTDNTTTDNFNLKHTTTTNFRQQLNTHYTIARDQNGSTVHTDNKPQTSNPNRTKPSLLYLILNAHTTAGNHYPPMGHRGPRMTNPTHISIDVCERSLIYFISARTKGILCVYSSL